MAKFQNETDKEFQKLKSEIMKSTQQENWEAFKGTGIGNYMEHRWKE